jgi:hypothetical protein
MSGLVKKVKDTFLGGAEKKAGQAAEAAGRRSEAFQRDVFEDTKAGLQPFVEGGQESFQKQQALSGALGPEAQAQAFADFQEDPGTAFAREQGLRLVNSKAGATGQGGGERLRELTKFSQGLALQDLSNRFNRLGAVTGTGLTAAQAIGGIGSNASSGIGQAIQGIGAAQGAIKTGGAAGLRGGIQQVAGGITGGLSGGFTGAVQGAFGV